MQKATLTRRFGQCGRLRLLEDAYRYRTPSPFQHHWGPGNARVSVGANSGAERRAGTERLDPLACRGG